MIDKSKEYPYSGIPTFLKSDYGTIGNLSNYSIGVFGVPVDIGVSNGMGARLGPSAIRKASTCYNPQTYYCEGIMIDFFQNQKKISISIPSILDLGDVPIYPTNFEKTLRTIENFAYMVTKKSFPIILGGDHSITFPVINGLIKGLKEKEKFNSLGIIHFDSHPDIWNSYITLDDVWHGSPFRKLLENEIIDGKNLVMIGDRALISEQEYDFINQHEITVYSISDIWNKGIESIIKESIAHLSERTDGIYISLDIDVFDPCYAPGTGTPLPGGLTTREMIQAFNIISATARLVGMDVVEVAPNYDPTGRTQDLAAFLLHRLLMLYKEF